MSRIVKIGITIGDPSGIGPEVILKALNRFVVPKDCQIYIFGDKVALSNNKLGLNDGFNFIDLNGINKSEFEVGVLSKKFGLRSYRYLEEAAKYLEIGVINALVTAPVSKEAISLNKINFFGHTEFLANYFNVKNFIMMFVSDNLKVSLITRHIPISDVARSVNKENVFKSILLTYQAIKGYFKIAKPRIAIAGINPHASENGIIGKEDLVVIKPAIKRFNKMYSCAYGPYPADTLFTKIDKFDAIVCCYHDQGLIPFKMLNFYEGVNLTVGLPFIRTSPDHGTAFDIAGKNIADYRSTLAAIKLAYKLTKNKLNS